MGAWRTAGRYSLGVRKFWYPPMKKITPSTKRWMESPHARYLPPVPNKARLELSYQNRKHKESPQT